MPAKHPEELRLKPAMELTKAGGIFTAMLPDDGTFPNSRLPLLVYPDSPAGATGDLASATERLFVGNKWSGCWRNGVYVYHHYHSTAHEVLGVCQGSGVIQFGGPGGVVVSAKAGDCIVIPAGVAHKLVERSSGFLVVGAYPLGQHYDLCTGRQGERPGTDHNISRVPLPGCDPVRGRGGPLDRLWEKSAE